MPGEWQSDEPVRPTQSSASSAASTLKLSLSFQLNESRTNAHCPASQPALEKSLFHSSLALASTPLSFS